MTERKLPFACKVIVCDSDSFDDVALVGSPDLHDSHVLAWHGDLLTDMDDDDLNDLINSIEPISPSLDRIRNE